MALIIVLKLGLGIGKTAFFAATYDDPSSHQWTIDGERELYVSLEDYPPQAGQAVKLYADWDHGSVRYRMADHEGRFGEWSYLSEQSEADEDGSYSWHEADLYLDAGDNQLEFKVSLQDG